MLPTPDNGVGYNSFINLISINFFTQQKHINKYESHKLLFDSFNSA